MASVTRILHLPRELRDNIYTHLWEFNENHDPNRDVLYWWDAFNMPWFEKDDDPSKSPWLTTPTMHLRPPHFIDQVFVGPIFAQEVLKSFKDTVGKDLRPVGERYPVAECGIFDGFIEDFVKKDVFGVEMTMEELTRNMDLRVTFQCDVLDDEDAFKDTESKQDLVEEYLSMLENAATALLSITPSDRVITHTEDSQHVEIRPRIIALDINQESNFLGDYFVRILRVVSRIYNGLRSKGFTVKVRYYSEAIKVKTLFEDDVGEWTDADWRGNLTRKNALGASASSSGSHSRAHVWSQLRRHLFEDGSSQASSHSL
ncbi:hypothetical protein DDE82_002675 [Stemphylium lycopersici]|nr:hypothetical protein TW65_04576 [Stemphylium lycopersici]RAR07701.1 hypothetical protein DDE82_002675 [Stemphylium lycopersici]